MSAIKGARLLSSFGRSCVKINKLHQRRIVALGLTSCTQVSAKKRALLDASPIPVNKFDLTTVGCLSPISSALFSTEVLSTDDIDSVEPVEDENDVGRIKKVFGKWPSPRDTKPNFTAHISGIGFKQNLDYVQTLFLKFGPIENVVFPRQGYKNSPEKNYGFITFKHLKSLKKALRAKSINDSDGNIIKIAPKYEERSRLRNYTDIFVKGFLKDITVEEINDYFRQFGKIAMINLYIPSQRSTSIYAVIRFKTHPPESFFSISHSLGNEKVSVDYFNRDVKDRLRCNKLFISDFLENISKEELKDHFCSYGKISKVHLIEEAGCGYIHFEDQESVALAAESCWHAIGSSDVKARRVGLVND